jgi:GNAT superfamily N-acetyltransferase
MKLRARRHLVDAVPGRLFRGEFLVTCELVYVFADPATQTSKPVPQALRDDLTGYEAGEPMRTVETGRDWAEARRRRGRVAPRGVRRGAAHSRRRWSGTSTTPSRCTRWPQPARPGDCHRAAAARGAGLSRIGRMAVHRNLRGGGHGAAVLRALEEAAQARGDREVTLHAQRSAEAFYARLGYAPYGEPFEEAGIAHIEMRRALR